MKKKTPLILEALFREYGKEYICYLTHENALQLLIATMLSAQCTDDRVNMVTKDLFKRYVTAEDFANARLEEMEKMIHSTGFYHNKAKNIIACCKELVEKYGGEVPNDMDALTNLAGVGRKTANVVRGHIFHEPSVVVDTHVKRISKKLGLTKNDDPVKVEFDLMKELPKDCWIVWNTHIIRLGRTICKAPTPKCEICFLQEYCDDFQKRSKKAAKEASKAGSSKAVEKKTAAKKAEAKRVVDSRTTGSEPGGKKTKEEKTAKKVEKA